MARRVTISHKKATFSLPLKVFEILQSKIEKNKRSEFVARAIVEKAERERSEEDIRELFEDFRKTAKIISDRDSLDIIREKRYELH